MKQPSKSSVLIFTLLSLLARSGSAENLPEPNCVLRTVVVKGVSPVDLGVDATNEEPFSDLTFQLRRPLGSSESIEEFLGVLRKRFAKRSFSYVCDVAKILQIPLSKRDVSNARSNLQRTLVEARTARYKSDDGRPGVRIFAVYSKGFFKKLGLRDGDVLISINSEVLEERQWALRKVIEAFGHDAQPELIILRDGIEITLKYSLE